MVGSARSEGPAAIEAPGARTTERTPPMAEQHPTPVLAGIYERISYDPKGDLLGTGRQEPPSRELCGRKGWTVVEPPYVDDDVSAYHPKRRPAYERLLADVAAGRITAIVAWHTDRLTRRPIENEGLIDLVERYHVKLSTVKVGDHDLETPAGRMQFRMLGVLARYEVEHMAERRQLMLADRAGKGLPNFGGVRPFGFQQGGMELDDDEGEVIRPAQWPAIVTPAERDQLRGLFARNPRRPGRPPKRLLVGLVFCGRPD